MTPGRLCSALLLLAGLSQAADVFLSPPQPLPSHLSLQHATHVLSQHLRLNNDEVPGLSGSNALFLLVDDANINVQDIIPPSMSRAFSVTGTPDTGSLTSLVTSYLRHASHAYSILYSGLAIPFEGIPRTLDLFSAPTPANLAFIAEISTLVKFIDSSSDDKFASLELIGLSQVAAAYGRSSEHYQLAARAIRAVLGACADAETDRVAVVTYTPSHIMRDHNHKRQSEFEFESRPLASQPHHRLASCLTTAEACSNATNDCSGHGQCVGTTNAGRECFVCACSNTKSALGKTESWAGDMCQRKDISSTFVLIAGTAIALVLLMGGSVSLLYSIGDHELPGILTGGVASGLKKE